MTSGGRKLEHFWFIATVGLFLLAAVLINPIRETPLIDDWAYALTVKHLLDSGEFRIHEFLSANMPVQAYYGALFCVAGGYGFAMLRLSTLVMSIVGLFAFYGLAREHRVSRRTAALLVLVLAGSPLYLQFSFNFMTNVPFITATLVALFCYTRALRRYSLWLVFAGSVAAAAALGIRVFGVALIAAIGIMMILDRDRFRHVLFYVLALTLPVLAAAWQLFAGSANANWGAVYATAQMQRHFAQPGEVASEFIWRPMAIATCVALFAYPPVVAAIVDLLRRARSNGKTSIVVGLLCFWLFGSLLFGALVMGKSWLMPLLPWQTHIISQFGIVPQLVVTIVSYTGGVALTWICVRHYVRGLKKELLCVFGF